MKKLALIGAAFLAFTWPASGQSAGASVTGTVTDQMGAIVRDATVTIGHTENGRTSTLTTGELGEYRAVAMLAGEYDLTASREGFAAITRRVTLLVGSDATVNFTLSVAPVNTNTTAVAEVPFVDPAQWQPSSTIIKQQIDSLPVLERNFLALAQVLPGSAPINSTVGRFAVTKFGGAGDQRSAYTTLIDGGDIDDAQWGSPTINVSQDALREFTVFRNQFDAQYGHALNAVVSVATRSGTNRYGGSGFYFGRDKALNARNAFASDKPPFDEHRIGGSFGGPIARDRSHFFAAYERDDASTARIIALPPANPLAATENGVFPAQSTEGLTTLRLDHRVNGDAGVLAAIRSRRPDVAEILHRRGVGHEPGGRREPRAQPGVRRHLESHATRGERAAGPPVEPHSRHGGAKHERGNHAPVGEHRTDQPRCPARATDEARPVSTRCTCIEHGTT